MKHTILLTLALVSLVAKGGEFGVNLGSLDSKYETGGAFGFTYQEKWFGVSYSESDNNSKDEYNEFSRDGGITTAVNGYDGYNLEYKAVDVYGVLRFFDDNPVSFYLMAGASYIDARDEKSVVRSVSEYDDFEQISFVQLPNETYGKTYDDFYAMYGAGVRFNASSKIVFDLSYSKRGDFEQPIKITVLRKF